MLLRSVTQHQLQKLAAELEGGLLRPGHRFAGNLFSQILSGQPRRDHNVAVCRHVFLAVPRFR